MLAITALWQVDIAILDQAEPGTHLTILRPEDAQHPPQIPPTIPWTTVIARLHAQRYTRPARRLQYSYYTGSSAEATTNPCSPCQAPPRHTYTPISPLLLWPLRTPRHQRRYHPIPNRPHRRQPHIKYLHQTPHTPRQSEPAIHHQSQVQPHHRYHPRPPTLTSTPMPPTLQHPHSPLPPIHRPPARIIPPRPQPPRPPHQTTPYLPPTPPSNPRPRSATLSANNPPTLSTAPCTIYGSKYNGPRPSANLLTDCASYGSDARNSASQHPVMTPFAPSGQPSMPRRPPTRSKISQLRV